MKTDRNERLKKDPASLRAMALGLLFDWLSSESFKSPATAKEMLGCPS